MKELARHTEKLFYFYEISHAKSLQATARKLNTSASTLSHAIKQLEMVIGGQVFIRSRQGVKLTELGKVVYSFCERFYRDLDEISQIAKTGDKKKIKLRFGTFSSIAIYLGPLIIKEISEKSDISISIATNRSSELLESLINKNIDVALTVETFGYKNLISTELYSDSFSFYISSSLKPVKITTDWLREKSILYIPETIDRDGKSLANHIHKWGLTFKDYFELDSLEVVAEFARKGIGIAVLPNNVAKSYAKELSLIKLPNVPKKFAEHRFFLSYRDDLDMQQKTMDDILKLSRSAVNKLYS